MLALIINEGIKLKRSLALLVCLAAPLCAAAFPVMVMLRTPRSRPWVEMLGEGAAVWAYLLLPMAVTALTVLIAQIEHGPRMWNHLLALPVSRAKIFAAKIVVVVALVLAMTVILYGGLISAVLACTLLVPGAGASGPPQLAETFLSLLLMNGASLTMVVVQLWIALRLRSFALPLVVGIVGTFFALCIQSAKAPVFLPWVAPAYAFTVTRPESLAVVLFGYLGGMVLIPIMLWRLSRLQRTS
jgi:hypothetical protein